jgi:anionic cell wall polymer biosynthesis LytR-Cps2A-Psr (LCP) family protein
MLIALNPKENTASIVSFPRDLYVSIPGVGQNRLNVAHAYGGFD